MVRATGRVALGIDVGTSSVKVTAITESGRVRTASSAPYSTAMPFDGAAEQNPDDWWSAMVPATSGLLGDLIDNGARISPETTIIGLTGQMHTSVLLGTTGEVVHPAMLWADKRAVAECRELMERVPSFADITGNVPMPAFTIAHLMWLRRHRPEAAAKLALVLNPKDEIRRRLGAGATTEPADASGTGLFDIRSDTWSQTVMDAIQLDPGVLPSVAPSHAVSGTVRGDAGSPPLLELLAGVPVTGGGGDQATQAVALGVTRPGQVGLSLGTSGVVFAALAQPQPGCFRHSYEGLWLALDSTHAAGLSLAWLASVTGTEVPVLTSSQAGPDDSPLFLPYLQGHRDSLSDGRGVPGAFVGLQAHHTREHLAYAVMEGVAFELARLAESLGVKGGDELRLGGGGGRSERWRGLIASAFGRPVSFADRDSSFGAAVIAAESAGWADEFAAANSAEAVVTQPTLELDERRTRFEDARTSLM